MSAVVHIVETMQRTQAVLQRLEPQLRRSPDDLGLLLTVRSIRDEEARLWEQLQQAGADEGVDLVDYRLFSHTNSRTPSLRAFTAVLHEFQDCVSVSYEAFQHGPRERPRAGAPAQAATRFGLAYVYPGSLGAVLTMPRQLLLIGSPMLDQAIEAALTMLRVEDPEQMAQYARQLGLGPVRCLYRWVHSHTAESLGAEIRWLRGTEERTEVLATPPQMERLEQMLKAGGEEHVEDLVGTGRLVGADIATNEFHLALPDGSDIRGEMEPSVYSEERIQLPVFCEFAMRKVTWRSYATEEERVRYLLTRLSVLPGERLGAPTIVELPFPAAVPPEPGGPGPEG